MLIRSPEYRDMHAESAGHLAEHNCLQYTYYLMVMNGVSKMPRHAGGVKISGNVVSNSAGTLRFLLASEQGIFLTPSFIVFEEVAVRPSPACHARLLGRGIYHQRDLSEP
jgi:hypothetical protein